MRDRRPAAFGAPTPSHGGAPSLRELQRDMAARVLATGDAEMRAGRLADWLTAAPGASLAERVAVYVDGYPARLNDALAEQFPAVRHLLGATRFRALVERYRRVASLATPNLNAVGAELPAFLAGDALARELPFLADLATLEWSIVCAFHVAREPDLDAASLGAGPANALTALRLRVQPDVAVHRSAWPLHALWAARETPLDQIDIDLSRGAAVLVRRDGLDVTCDPIEPAEAEALGALMHGATLGELAESLAADGVDPRCVGTWFAGWMQRGVFAAL
jgi:hypothetical protein